MADGSRLKVALLARAGDAREQLKRAITELGAELVVEADPNDLAPGALVSAGATTVLVSVEPAVEAALDRLEDDLLEPSLNVMFDEAETTAKLGGWDLNRWARHLAAKLLGCGVLPPGAEPEAHQEAAAFLEPGVPTTPAALADEARIDDFAAEINASAADVPSAYRPSDAPPTVEAADTAPATEVAPPADWVTPPVEEGDPEHLELDLAALEQAMQTPVVDVGAAEPASQSAPAAFAVADDPDVGMIDLRGLELVDDVDVPAPERPSQPSVSLLSAKEISFDAPTASSSAIDADALSMDVEELTLTDEELAAFGEGGGFRFSSGGASPAKDEEASDDTLAMDPELAKLAASFDENLDSLSFEGSSEDLDDGFADFDRRETPLALGPQGETPLEPERAFAEPPPIPDFDFAEGAYVSVAKPAAMPIPDTSGLSLSAEDAAPVAPAPAAANPAFNFAGLGGLELAPIDDVPAVAPPPPPLAEPVVIPDVAHLSLSPLIEEGAEAAAATGTVLVLSGIGGPDAVRQLLRALPASFPHAVLLQQNLDGGRHDRFVEQLAKISRLPVALAEPTETPPQGAVRVLPEGLSSAGALSFPKAEGVAALIAAATVMDGAVVVLSGADEAVVEPLVQAMANGTRVLVQDPASCFDAKAIVALQAAGASPVSAADIAARLDAYFPT
ncbi:chemotaxis protein CheB [Silanimonas sp.]|uniref:chemotaxis protein CheB n=1 Tax=Silanimonas sp. TaxID=1929290 RepID=UPI0037C564A9